MVGSYLRMVGSMVGGHVGSSLDLGKSGKRVQRNPAADQFNQANHPPESVSIIFSLRNKNS